jgi:hypothetical protein
MLQITPKSRSEVPEYQRMQRELAEEVGRINGKFGDVDWTPLRYINKPMNPAALAGLYRMSRVGLVTPLRDGMNLVAKEYVAAQAPDNPGVLVLSQFAGAAHELKNALIINPYYIEATADALARAFVMPLDERKDRWRAMMAVLRANTVHDWASHFLEALTAKTEDEKSGRSLDGTEIAGAAGMDRPETDSILPWRRRSAGKNIEVPVQLLPSALPGASSKRRAASGTLQPIATAPQRLSALGRNGSAAAAAADPAPALQDDHLSVD